MALVNKTTNEYLRFSIKDNNQINIGASDFVAQLWKNESVRRDPSTYDKFFERPYNFSDDWNLTVTGETTLDEITTECYRCLSLIEPFKSDWESDETPVGGE